MMDTRRMSAGLVLVIGFVAGVAFVASCGGSGQPTIAAGADGGVEVVRHLTTVGPQTASSGGVLNHTLYSTTFTPPNPNDVVLRVTVRGTYTTADTSIYLSLRVRNASSTATYASESEELFVATNRPFQMSTSFHGFFTHGGTGAPDGGYSIKLDVSSGNPVGSAIDVGTLEIEVVTLEGVTRQDPSPLL